MQTHHLSAGTAVAAAADADVIVLELCILSVALFHRRNLLLAEVLYWQNSFCLYLWKETDSVD